MASIEAPTLFATARLSVRPIGEGDAGFVRALLNDPGFLTHIGDRGVRTREEARAYIRDRIEASYREHGFGMYRAALHYGDVPIGLIGFVRRDGLDGPDLGFALLAAHTGRGYGYEAAAAALAWGHEALRLGPLLAVTAPDNHVSAALLAKLGFREEGRVSLPGHDRESRLFREAVLSPA